MQIHFFRASRLFPRPADKRRYPASRGLRDTHPRRDLTADHRKKIFAMIQTRARASAALIPARRTEDADDVIASVSAFASAQHQTLASAACFGSPLLLPGGEINGGGGGGGWRSTPLTPRQRRPVCRLRPIKTQLSCNRGMEGKPFQPSVDRDDVNGQPVEPVV